MLQQHKMMETEALKQKIVECLKNIFDPEIPVNIYELGLIYEIEVLPINNVQIVMTLTAPNCPAAQSLPIEVDQKVRQIERSEEHTSELQSLAYLVCRL